MPGLSGRWSTSKTRRDEETRRENEPRPLQATDFQTVGGGSGGEFLAAQEIYFRNKQSEGSDETREEKRC